MRAFFYSVVVIVLFSACGSSQSAPAVHRDYTARDYFPLHADAAWSFDSVDMDSPGTPGLITMHVIRDDGAGGFYMQQGRGAPAIYEFADGSLTRNGEPILQAPIAAGTRWLGHRGDSSTSYSIRQVGLTRSVTAGTFHDVIEVVRSAPLNDGTDYQETYFYAPAVGPIEAIVPIMLPNGTVRRFLLKLRAFTLDGNFMGAPSGSPDGH